MKCLSLALLLLLFTIVATSQYRKAYSFTNYSTSNGGLATNLINSIAQDDKGYIWLAIYNGLQRFDENKFLTFRNASGNNTSIPYNNIQTLLFDKQHRLWLTGTNNTVGYFNTTHLTFKETPLQKSRNAKGRIANFRGTPSRLASRCSWKLSNTSF